MTIPDVLPDFSHFSGGYDPDTGYYDGVRVWYWFDAAPDLTYGIWGRLTSFKPIPQPSSLALVGLGAVALVAWRRRRRG